VQQLHLLSKGIVNLLSRMFHMDRGVPFNEVLVGFVSRLGATPEGGSINITQAAGFWELERSWELNPITPRVLPSGLEARFALLCLLFPFPANQSRLQDHETASTFTSLTALLNCLIAADYSASPRAGLAFLQAMYAYNPHCNTAPATAAPQEPLTIRTALLATMLCELCRALEHTYGPAAPSPKRNWDIGSILGVEAQDAAEKLPIGWLAAALRDTTMTATGGGVNSSRGQLVKERLKGGCGDRFCVFSMPIPATSSSSASSGDAARANNHIHPHRRIDHQRPTADGNHHRHSASSSDLEEDARRTGESSSSSSTSKEMGLLHCGENSCSFLVLDFEGRSLRLVDCRLAWMRPNAAEPRKLDLLVSRPAVDGGEELMKIEAAPRDVAAFWLRYALEDV
jgi:hypothetical protein